MRPKTGEIVWHYQFTPNDHYDYDAQLGNDPRRHRRRRAAKRKVLMQLNRNGFLYVIDRTNGKLISAKPFEKVNWATRVDMKTGRPIETDIAKKLRAGETGRAVADAARRQELAARRVQSGDRPALRQHHALGADVQASAGRSLRARTALHVRGKSAAPSSPRASRSAMSTRSIR